MPLPSDDTPPPRQQGEYTRLTRGDLRLFRRAARERWGVPDELQTEAIFQTAKLLKRKDPKLKLAAIKALLDFYRADQREDTVEIRKQLLGLKRRIDPSAQADPTAIDPAAAGRLLDALLGETNVAANE